MWVPFFSFQSLSAKTFPQVNVELIIINYIILRIFFVSDIILFYYVISFTEIFVVKHSQPDCLHNLNIKEGFSCEVSVMSSNTVR